MSRRSQRPQYAELHQKRIAVLINQPNGSLLLHGTAHHEQDPEHGSVLRIESDELDGAIVLQESTFEGEFAPGAQYQCDYVIELDYPGEASP